MMKFWKKSLLVQIVGSFSMLSFGIISLVGSTTFFQARKYLQQSVYDRLTTVASLEEGELNRWMIDRRDTLTSLTQISEIRTAAEVLLTQGKSDANYQVSLETIQRLLSDFIFDRSDYREIFIISSGGRVVVSTDAEKIGRYSPRDQTSEMFQGSAHTSVFVSNFYQSPDTNLPTVTLSTPIFDSQNRRVGTLAAHLNLDRVDEITATREGMGKTGKSYLVTDIGSSFDTQYVFISAQEFAAEDFPNGIISPGIQAAMTGNNGRGLYNNYEGIPVIGVYRWLKGEDVALMVEMHQAEAFALANRLALSILLTGLILSGMMTVMILLLGHRIVTPILAVAQTARSVGRKVKEGNLSKLELVPIQVENEIGILAHTFNQMTEQLRDSYTELQEKNQELQSTLNELQQTQFQLIQNEKMASLGQMVAGIAHEVNNPIGFIHGNLDYLNEYVTDLLDLLQVYSEEYPEDNTAITQQKENIEFDFLQRDLSQVLSSMRTGTTRIQEIVKSMRNFSRLDEADYKAANINEGLEGTLLILHHRFKAESHRSEIKVIKDYGQIPKIECYPGQLNQVFLNLISNAIDELESSVIMGKIEDPTIHIRTAIEEKNAVIYIADNGTGMPEETCKKVFDPFFTTKPIGKGTGLGLSISYSIVVEHHGGEINCQSVLGKGTEFTIVIPTHQMS